MINRARHITAVIIAFRALLSNSFRSMLTALGIIFGVAAVIAMLAIGTGAKQEIMEEIKLVGVNNIVISKKLNKEEDESSYSSGLTVLDAESIEDMLPTVAFVSPEIVYETFALRNGIGKETKLIGVSHEYFEMFGYKTAQGNFFGKNQEINGMPVCVIGTKLRAQLFNQEDPVGKEIKVNQVWLKVIGVYESRNAPDVKGEQIGLRNYDQDIYMPYTSLLLRYKNRTLINTAILEKANSENGNNRGGGAEEEEKDEIQDYHQIDKIIVQVKETSYLSPTAETISRMLLRRHSDVVDFEIEIPELLLKQERKSKEIFNIVLGAIAAISLLVGGIGIMNIMLASVMERIREIGLRMALGATREDIIFQFLYESMFLSLGGGLIGVFIGVGIAYTIESLTGIMTIVSVLSVVVSFGVSAAVGLIFGLAPAKKAANQDPVTSLRN